VEAHGGRLAVEVLRRYGVDTMFTLSGGHLFVLYDGAVQNGELRLIDTRHEQTAVFAAEGWAKVTRQLGCAAITAGPGVTNGVSAMTAAWMNGSPVVVLAGRAPQLRWGAGSLQEMDHVPVLASITKTAGTVKDPTAAATAVHTAAATALTPHRGPTFLDFPMDVVFAPSSGSMPAVDRTARLGAAPDAEAIAGLAKLIGDAERPAFIVGSDVYWEGAEDALRSAVEHLRVPCFFNGLGRGTIPADHDLAFLRTRGLLKSRADLVVVLGTPLDFRLGFGQFGDATVAHVVDSEAQRAGHIDVHTVAGDIRATLQALADAPLGHDHADWITELSAAEVAGRERDAALLDVDDDPIRPSRIYGELGKRLARDAVVICDGGDFASYAGKFVEVFEPGCWLDTGPYGCLGNGPGYAIAARTVKPSAQIALLLGDGAAGFSLMDVDSMVRHDLPVVMVVGNNGMWGLEKHPMQAVYGWDMACDLQPGCRYDEVVRDLGGAGETVTEPAEVGPALDRAFAAGVPYLVNVLTEPSDVYPRSSNLG